MDLWQDPARGCISPMTSRVRRKSLRHLLSEMNCNILRSAFHSFLHRCVFLVRWTRNSSDSAPWNRKERSRAADWLTRLELDCRRQIRGFPLRARALCSMSHTTAGSRSTLSCKWRLSCSRNPNNLVASFYSQHTTKDQKSQQFQPFGDEIYHFERSSIFVSQRSSFFRIHLERSIVPSTRPVFGRWRRISLGALCYRANIVTIAGVAEDWR